MMLLASTYGELIYMKSLIKYLDAESNSPTDCGEPLVIELSSRELNWQGILLEKGWAPFFHPRNVYTDYFYFALATSGSAEWKAIEKGGERVVKAEPGDIWLNPPKSAFTHDVESPCFFTILLMSEDLLFRSFGSPLAGLKLNFLNQYNIRDIVLANIIELFEKEAACNGINGPQYLRNLINLFSDYFIRNYSDYSDQLTRAQYSALSPQKMADLDEYIAAHIGEEMHIDNLAAIFCMSKFYFLKEFKKLHGITPYQYVLRKRVKRAAELLREKRSLAHIAYETGFSDQSHLTRVFKSITGKTPLAFRRKNML